MATAPTARRAADPGRVGARCCPPRRSTPTRPPAALAARREQLEQEIARAEGKLANEGFVSKAPAEVVEAERQKLDEYRRALERLGSP